MTTRLLPTFFAVAIMVLFSTTAFSQAVGSITVDFNPDASLELQQKTDIPPTFDADPQMWSQGTDLPGGGKKFHAVASYDGDIFTFGGVTVQGNQLFLDPTSYRYETGTAQWVPLANFPISNYQYGHAQAIGDKIYIFGGYEDNGNGQITTHPEMYIYDPNTNQFTVGASMLVTNTQIRGASVVLDGKIYFIGGYTVATGAQFTAQVQIYDPAIDQWSLGQAYPIPVSFVSAAALDDKIIAVGGYNSTGAIGSVYYTANAYVGELDAGTLTWRQVADYPVGGIIHHSGVGINNVGYFFAGRPVIDNNPYAASYGFSFDGDTETWASMEKKPLAMRTAPQAGTDGTKIYSVGGERSGGFPVTTMEIYDPSIDLYFDPVVWRQIVVQTYSDGNLTPKSNEISIMNDGPADFEWTASVTDGSEWMSLSVTSGGGLGYFPEMTEVTVDPSGLSAGQTTGEITISTNDPATTELKIPVHVFITSEPVTVEQDVLIEEFSGTWCGWCPYGVDSLEALKDRHGDRINVLTYHSGTHDPFDTQPVSEVLNYLSVTSYPSAAFNRSMPLEGQEQQNLSRGEWGAATRAILAGEGAPVNIEFTNKTFDENTGAVNVTVEATFLQAIPGDIRMQLIQTTNDRNVGQVEYYVENNQVRARLVYPYFHDHVVELILPDPVGEPLTNAGEEYIMPGTKITKDFSFTSIDSIPELSDLTVFVHEYIPGTPGKVFQSYSEQLWVDVTSIGGNPNPGHFALEQNYPNPFNPTTTIEYTVANRTDVRIVVTDMLGREVATIVDEAKSAGTYITTFNANGLESGTYYMTMQAGDFRSTRALTLMK